MKHRAWIHSAITDDNGEVDVGNLGLFVLVGLVLGAIPFACAAVLARAILSIWHVDFIFDVQALGIAIGAICSGFATAIGGWGAARRLADNKGAVDTVTLQTKTRGADGSAQESTQQIDAH